MSSGCGDVLSLADLQTAKKHQLFEAEVITGKAGGVAGGADIDYATNQVTGQTQKTLPAVLRDAGVKPAPFDFSTGGILGVNDRDLSVLWPISAGGDGNYYIWKGALPKAIPASSSPATTGGISDSAWMPVTDGKLRDDLASSSGASLVGFQQAPFINRTVGDYLTDIPTNKYFGAKCDGITDDTAANQTALDWSSSEKRDVIFIGKSCVSSRLVHTSGAKVRHLGTIVPKNFTDQMVIEVKDDAWRDPYNDGITAIETGNRILIDGLHIEPSAAVAAQGIYGTDGVGVVINNARIFNMSLGGVEIEKGYEWKFNNLSVVSPSNQLSTAAVSGIKHRTYDSMYMNTTVVGYQTGMEITSDANDVVNTHVWGLTGTRTTRTMGFGLKLSGSSNNIYGFYADSPHKIDSGQPASASNGGVGYLITGFNNNLTGPRILFHPDDGALYGKAFLISGTENSIVQPVTTSFSGFETGGDFVFSGSASPVNNLVYGGNMQGVYTAPQNAGFNPTLNIPCTYTTQVYRHELTQRNVEGRVTVVANVTSNSGTTALALQMPPYLSGFKGTGFGASAIGMLLPAVRSDTNLIGVEPYVNAGKIYFRLIFRSGSARDVLFNDVVTGLIAIDISFSAQL